MAKRFFILFLILPSALFGQDLSLRLGSRYGNYYSGVYINSNLAVGGVNFFSQSFFGKKSTDVNELLGLLPYQQQFAGVSIYRRWINAAMFVYSYRGQKPALNAQVGFNFGGTSLTAYFMPIEGTGNLSINTRLGSALISACGSFSGPSKTRSGQIDVSIPVTIHLGKKHKAIIAKDEASLPAAIVVQLGAMRGRMSAEGKPLADMALDIAGTIVRTDRDGAFEVRGLRPGKYTVRVLNLPIFYACDPTEVEIRPNEIATVFIEAKAKSR